MKFKKLAITGWVITAAMTNMGAYAQSTQALSNQTQLAIHVTTVHIAQVRQDIQVGLVMGNVQDSQCVPAIMVKSYPASVKTGLQFFFNGDEAAFSHGVGFGCAQEVYVPKYGAQQVVTYFLVSNGKTYVAANPSRQDVYIPH